MKTSSHFGPPRFLAFAVAMGATGSLVAADTKFITPPRVERVVEKDAPVYMIVEDPASPEGATQVIEIVPATPLPATRKSRSKSTQRGETLYLEEFVVPKVIPVETPSRPSSSSKERTTSSKPNGSSSKKTATVQKPATSKSASDDTAREVEKLKERVNKLQGELNLAQQKSTDRAEVLAATKSETLPSSPGFTATEERLPVVTPPPPLEVTQTKVIETTLPEKRLPNASQRSNLPLPQAEDPIDPPSPTPVETVEKDAPAPPGKANSEEDAPMAKKTGKPGFVTSPYPPHRLIDVRGMAPGTLAKDPSTEEVFRIP
jgi:hypothetical protein